MNHFRIHFVTYKRKTLNMINKNLIPFALLLSVITIVYNVGEGIVSIYFGLEDDTLALLGFGVDSFVEVISGIGVLHLVLRMKYDTVKKRDSFERMTLRITGYSFYLLTAGLIFSSGVNILENNKPETTLVGVIVSVLSIITMYFLKHYKLKVGKELNSDAIIADAKCTETCFYLSFVLLGASVSYELLQIAYIDIAGSLGIAWFAFTEGKESLEKAKSGDLACGCENDNCST